MFEIGVRSIIPLSVLQTQVAFLPGTGGHLVPDGGTGLSLPWATEGTTGAVISPTSSTQKTSIISLHSPAIVGVSVYVSLPSTG